MLEDAVIDANVVGHAQNPGLGSQFDEASKFLEALLTCDTILCLDDNSRILNEYMSVVGAASLATSAITQLLSAGRYIEHPAKVTAHVRIIVNRLVRPEKPVDRLYLRIASHSHERVVVSHDGEDFHDECRLRVKADLRIRIPDAREALALL